MNSRFFDYSIKLSPGLEPLEQDIRRETKRECQRGRISVFVSAEYKGRGTDGEVVLDKERFEGYLSLLKMIEREYGEKISISDIVDVKELIIDRRMDVIGKELVLGALREAVAKLKTMRSREGEIIATDFLTRIEKLKAILDEVRSLTEDLLSEVRETYEQRIRELMARDEVLADDGRVLQEAAILAEKLDISEECVRCASHLEQFKTLLEADDPVGKRLNFLLQEISREINTIGSKTNKIQIAERVITMKDEVEKLREQVQNVL